MESGDDEYANFDPRSFWASVNNEEREFTLVEQKYKEKLNKILDALKLKPLRNIEISELIGVRQGSVNKLLWDLKEMGCKVDTIKSKMGTFYHLKYRPNVLVRKKKSKR